MSIESKDIIIGESEYTITQFTTSKGLKYLKQITKILAPSFAALSEGAEATNMDIHAAIQDGTVQTESFSKAVNLLVENMDKEDVVELIKNLVNGVRKNNKDINFEMDFAANYGELSQLLIEVCKYNYSSVFQNGGLGFAALQTN
jgi:hypothetical protein